MATSLARRIRRIGILPTRSVADIMDDNHRAKLANATTKVQENPTAENIALLKEVEEAIGAELAPRLKQRLDLTPAEIAAETAKLKEAAKAKRLANRKAGK